MKRKILLLAAGVLIPSLLGAGENLFYNSSFEMGLDGWDKGQLKFNYGSSSVCEKAGIAGTPVQSSQNPA